MSIISAAFSNQISGFNEAFKTRDITSEPMKSAIQTWFALYFGDSKNDEADMSQRLPYVVVNKIYKAAFGEYDASVSKKGDKAEFMGRVLNGIGAVKKKGMQLALVGGEAFIKPVPRAGGFDFTIVRRDCYLVLSRSITGNPTSIGCAERSVENGAYFTLLERRTIGADGLLTIENKLFRSYDGEALGTEITLNSIERYAALSPTVTLPEPCGLGMALLKTPMENCVDGSDDGVSVYAPAVGLICNINRNEQQINDEFDNGASRIIVSDDLTTRDEDGKKKLTDKQFIAIDDDPENIGVTIFSPAFREQSYLARKQEYLRNVETQIGLKRGIISEAEAVERTATEITSSAGDYNLTIIDFQQMWDGAVRETLGICDALGRMYHLCGDETFDPGKDISINWGDGVLFNRDKAWAELSGMVAAGMLKPEIAIAWYYNLPMPDNAKALNDIRAKYMPEMEQLVEGGDE